MRLDLLDLKSKLKVVEVFMLGAKPVHEKPIAPAGFPPLTGTGRITDFPGDASVSTQLCLPRTLGIMSAGTNGFQTLCGELGDYMGGNGWGYVPK